MTRFIRSGAAPALGLLVIFSLGALAQKARQVPAKTVAPPITQTNSNLDKVAVQALKTMSGQLRGATSFTFNARIMREEPGTNGQMLDFFRHISAEVQRPNRMRFEVKSDTSDVNLWYNGKNVTIMPAKGNMYTVLPAPTTIDATLTMLRSKLGSHTPLRSFLGGDPYAALMEDVQSAHEVGVVNAGNEQFLHLAFREPDADWQLWLSGPNQVLPRRMSIVYTKLEGQPRMNIEFTDWHLDAQIPDSAFVFSKPAGAAEVPLSAVTRRPVQPNTTQKGGKTK